MNIKYLNFFFLIFFLLSFPLNAINIATINIELIINSNNQYSLYLKDFDKKKDLIQSKILDSENELLNIKNEIENLQYLLEAKEIELKISIYNDKVNQHASLVDLINTKINNNLLLNQNIILTKIIEISKQISIDNNYDIIFSEKNFFLSSDNIDLSNKIIDKLNMFKLDLITLNEGQFFE